MLHHVQERCDGRALAVPSGFVRDQLAERFAAELRFRAAELGIDRIELVIDPALPNPETPEVDTAAPQTRPRRLRTSAADRALSYLTPDGAGTMTSVRTWASPCWQAVPWRV